MFGNLVVSECFKAFTHQWQQHPLFYWRDQTGLEIDQIIEESSHLYAVEIKSGQTVSPDMFDTLLWWSTTTGNPPEKTILVYGGDHASSRAGIRVFPWSSV